MAKTLTYIAHPNLEEKSLSNKIIIDNLREKFADMEIRDLTKLYPDFKIDVEAEQKKLIEADVIVFQFPFFWYSIPAILKHFLDEVFTYGFAYGSTGDKLKGKKFILSFTIGGPEESYSSASFNREPIVEYLKPLVQTASLSGMEYLDPIFTHGMIYIPGVYNVKEEVEERARGHAKRLSDVLLKL
eukprot:TRINITY_DN779963_c0_g1_i1.p1 TRINITY_DN779963_c0_g1~~TRINITY_DN779963_c0_g1_i1.p1  ORF type:complete len:217 (+),score=37.72 TRINITY_DN779963_c0_g1_i1:96-653(+)